MASSCGIQIIEQIRTRNREAQDVDAARLSTVSPPIVNSVRLVELCDALNTDAVYVSFCTLLSLLQFWHCCSSMKLSDKWIP